MHSNPTNIVRPADPGGNRQLSFQRWELPPRTEGTSFTTSENVARARKSLGPGQPPRHE
jgi:hypothetical protein